MGDKETTKSARPVDMGIQEVEPSEGNFQNVICELLEKNGVMGDLRAYLRQNIVNVLRSADSGETPACQKHFAQRLELTSQAINILIAEYLLRFDFSYSLSVYLAEIPLANMVFDFANNLMMGEDAYSLRFKTKDIWSILNYLGIKCDSTFVRNVLESYHNKKSPLLVCILKNLAVLNNYRDEGKSETSTLTGATRSPHSEHSDLLTNTTSKIGLNKCQHLNTCQMCSSQVQLWKDKYLKAKLLLKNQRSIDSMKAQQFLSNVDTIEGNVISEMFEDVRTVYETEMDKMRSVEEHRRQYLELHRAAMEQALRQKMEASLKAREQELESNMRAKKQFLFELARSLREQQTHVAQAARAITRHAHQLRDKEDQQKSHFDNIERLLKRRDNDIQSQISSEMNILAEKLDRFKTEPLSVERERSSLDQLKEKQQRVHESPSEESLQLLQKDLSVLTELMMKATRPEAKCLIDCSTVTDLNSLQIGQLLNNEQDVKAIREDYRIKNSQVVNDLKKKNVNFCADLTSVMRHPEDGSGSQDSSASRASDVINRLKQENEQLREYARQQEQHVQQLSQSSAILRAELSFARDLRQPSTAPATPFLSRGGGVGRSLVGAGEELSLLPGPPRTLLPEEPVPFIGLLRDRDARPDNKRLLNHWKCLRRISPARARRAPAHDMDVPTADKDNAGPSYMPDPEQDDNQPTGAAHYSQPAEKVNQEAIPKAPPSYTITNVNRTKSAKSVIREAKEKLRNHAKFKLKEQMPSSSREKSPASVLRDAKQKLRKLEIEAEAVERSYNDFKKRQLQSPQREEAIVTKDVEDIATRSSEPTSRSRAHSDRKLSLDKYLSESIRKLNDAQFANRNTSSAKVKPIPPPFSEVFEKHENLLETQLTEFRKYYKQSQPVTIASAETRILTSPFVNKSTTNDDKKEVSISKKNNKVIELEILQNNIHKMYNIKCDSPKKLKAREEVEVMKTGLNANGEQLRIEVEPVKGMAVVNCKNEEEIQQNLVVVLQSKVDTATPLSPIAMSIATFATTNCSDRVKSRDCSPKRKERSKHTRSRSISPEQAAQLTKNDVLEAIFHKNTVTIRSSSVMREPTVDFTSKDADYSIGTHKGDSYEDDFSGDADNYNSRPSSPVSLPVSPPDDAFWNDS